MIIVHEKYISLGKYLFKADFLHHKTKIKVMKIDKTFDAKMLEIKDLNPNWLPWIGKDFNSPENKKRILVVGESCYLTEDVDVNQDEYIRKLIEKDGTLDGWYETNQFIGQRHIKLEQILSIDPNDVNSKRKFWEKSVYFNLIQTPLESRDEKYRPLYPLFLTGWEVFFQLLAILNPHYCIMNGVQSYDHFYERYAEKFGYSTVEKIKLEKIGNTHPRKIILENISSGNKIKILFIQHSSSRISKIRLESWQTFIKSELL